MMAANKTPHATLPERQLGSGLSVSAIGYGCMGLDTGYGKPLDREAARRAIRKAFDCGITLFDTAEIYGPYTNEELLGEALHDVRNQVCYATKFGARIIDGRPAGLDSRPEAIVAATESALKRLRTDYLDILFQHRVDTEVPIEDVAGCVQRLIEVGKVRAFGLSEPGAQTLRRAHAVQQVAAVQSEYSIWTRDPETNGILDACAELGTGFVAFSPLSRGYLAGALRDPAEFEPGDARSTMPRFKADAMMSNSILLAQIRQLAERHGTSIAQISLAWLLHRAPWIVPIPGSRSLDRISENVAAIAVELAQQEWDAFDSLCSEIEVVGLRYPEQMLKLSGR